MARTARSDNSLDMRLVEEWMGRAAEIAVAECPHPNPRVGALVIDDSGRIVAEGAHGGPGLPHAEASALASAGKAAKGATVVVTLEPCAHYGLTPPCTEILISAGVARVIVGSVDPDSRVAGKGLERLRASGIQVILEDSSAENESIDPAYFHHRRTGRAMITVKVAATLDGQTAAADFSSQWITSPEARLDAHALRAESDAVVVGSGTVLADNPRLTVRLPGYNAPQPKPVVVAGKRPLPMKYHIFDRDPVIFVPSPPPRSHPGDWIVAWSNDGVDLVSMAKTLGDRGLLNVMVEGGPTLFAALLKANLVDRIVLYLGAKLAGGMGQGIFQGLFPTIGAQRDLDIHSVRRVGPDLRIDAELKKETENF